MNKGRLEAFSDGVLAIIITIMVLEIKVPHGHDLKDLKPLIPIFLSYLLSFIYIGIYWNNHHHMLHTAKQVRGDVLWANLHLLFWLSLIPFVTGWMGENHFQAMPMALYGIVLLMAALAYFLLQRRIIVSQGENSILKKAVGKDIKGKISPIIYLISIAASFLSGWLAGGGYVLVALIWLIPDKRIERILKETKD
ncbi:TMEM175 family protein [Mangrovibacterium diazotrophicum]|uniref:Putative membrane protein n=1 Tax=Mangrovibacterium diazotrophicum TaxID=1261403 RepID=A0A419W9V3_9BACT|nr:TMEM175 family protein [Mangrovibacterium diazotrophicum]RKD92255.1 putative membrane protein [Mangrovibacterium diazotrophicum]